jgi:hypothetical protein
LELFYVSFLRIRPGIQRLVLALERR